MGPSLLLLLLLGLAGRGSVGSLPELLRAPLGSSILVQCHYRLQDLRARKVWCRLSPQGCQPLASSAVDRTAPGGGRTVLTDLGGGLLQVEMIDLQEEDAGQYGCVVEGALGPQTLHMVSLEVLPPEPGPRREGKEETRRSGGLSEDPVGSASPWELGSQERSIPLIWGAVLLLGLLVTAVVLFAVLAKRKGSRRGAGGPLQSSGVSGMGLSTVVPHGSESGLAAGLSSDTPHVRLDPPPAFDNTTYANCPLGPPSGKPPAPPPPSLPPLPPKILTSSNPVTYATVIFPGGDKGGGAGPGSP